MVMLWQILLIVTHSIEFRAFQDLHYPLFLKVVSNSEVRPKLRFKSALPTSNDILFEHWIGLISSLESKRKKTTARQCDILLLVAPCIMGTCCPVYSG